MSRRAISQSPEIKRRSTILDVAREANVSRSSVSNYLNNRMGQLSPETRERIASAMAALDYRPNRLAQQLRSGRVPVIGLLVPTVVNPHFAELALAIEIAAAAAGYRVLLCNTMRDPDREQSFANELAGYGIRDIITVSPLNHRARARQAALQLDGNGIAVVAIDAARSDLKLSAMDTVNVDDRAAVALAVDHLHACGHRSIAYVTDQLFTHSRIERMAGFRAALARHRLDDNGIIVLDGPEHTMGIADTAMADVGRSAATAIMALDPRPTAVVALSDMVAVGLLAAFRETAVAVPAMISVIGIDDVPMAALLSPALTTVRQPVTDMAQTAVDRIVTRMSHPTRAGTDTVFQPELVSRETVALIDRDRSGE